MSTTDRWSRIPTTHPRVLGPLDRLRTMARERADAYRRMAAIARDGRVDEPRPDDPYATVSRHAKLVSLALVAAIEGDAALQRDAVDLALAWYVDQPIRTGHVTFGHDVADSALVYDLCHAAWTPAERSRFHAYANATRDANLDEEPSPFHNGWWGYKNAGFGIAWMATMHENPRAPELMAALDAELRASAHPALALAGHGGSFVEGFYTHYWTYEWLAFCEAALLCAGVDLYADVPEFYRQRAVASMFEMYPGLHERDSRRGVCFGDGHGRRFGPERERDKARACRDILVARFRDDPAHRAVAEYQSATPRAGADENAYKDFLWRDPGVAAGGLDGFALSHYGAGAGKIHARSSWREDATYLAFSCAKRFTSHQHLDVGHFFIYRGGEQACRSGHYVDFSGDHDVNYYIRSIAHNTVLVHDPDERWPDFMKGHDGVADNDGGQAWPWVGTPFRHNGVAIDLAMWRANPELGDIAEVLAYQDEGAFLYLAGDCTRAYSPRKLARFTREIVFLRPGTFVMLDRVRSTDARLRKTWLLQTPSPPKQHDGWLVTTNGEGRLFTQALLPERRQVAAHSGPGLYRYGGRDHPPGRDSGPGADCRIEISPSEPALEDVFLNVLTATPAAQQDVPVARLRREDGALIVDIAGASVRFADVGLGGSVACGGRRIALRTLDADEARPWAAPVVGQVGARV
ncbi:MAG TPA: heparinase II/III family protein [Planctomycetota bacterium]|nr:heparinase II/III family protein [Planctomycetota bacterium]